MKPVRETLLGMVDAMSDAKRRAWPQANENLRQAASLGFPGLARRHSQFPAVQVIWQCQGGVTEEDCVGPALALN